ncbi:unnamed protein product [Mortierella alpina]
MPSVAPEHRLCYSMNPFSRKGPTVPRQQKTISLEVRNLSLSVVDQTPPFFRLCKRIKGIWDTRKQPVVDKGDKDEICASATSKDVREGVEIFRNVSLVAEPGQVCLVVGGSGSGKTTLLNALANRINKRQMATSGDIRINDDDPKIYRKNGQIGYLQQEDYLLPFITVRETLQFACDLRLPSTTSQQEKTQVVDDLILELGLKSCVDILIGDAYASESGTGGTRGISGGERRRVSAALQLLTSPSLLICDEVTSGLDAFTSFELVKTLEKYARLNEKTVVLSIHQPRSEIFHLLSSSGSQLVLLAQGDIVYSGPLDKALSWFESVGIERCSKHVNPFDHILDLSVVDYSTEATEKASRIRIAMLVEAWSKRDSNETNEDAVQSFEIVSAEACSGFDSQHDAGDASDAPGPGIWNQTRILCDRAWKSQIRNRQMLWGNFMFCILMSLALGVIFWRTDNSTFESVRARTSVCIILVLAQPFISLIVDVIEYSEDIKVYERERRDRWYEPLPYLLSHLICAIPRNIVHSIAHVSIIFFAVGLRTDASTSFSFYIVTLAYMSMQFVRNVMSIACVALCRNFDFASIMACALLTLFSSLCGFFIPISGLPAPLSWLRHIVLSHVGYRVMVSSIFTDQTLAFGLSGNTLLEGILEVPVHYYPGPLLQLVGHFVAYFLLAWLFLSVINPNRTRRMPDMSPIEAIYRFFSSFFINWTALDRAKPRKGKEVQRDEVGSMKGLDGAEGHTRVEIFGNSLTQRQPVMIKVEKLSLVVNERAQGLSGRERLQQLFSGQRSLTRKPLLQSIDAVMLPAQLTAILGGSGSGKTTFINALLHRTPPGLKVSGNIYYNGSKNPSMRKINTVCGYVRQEDGMLMAHLTVRETLRYAAELGMPKSLKKVEKWAKVDEIIDLIGLRECKDVLVGDDDTSGISGGQRRRVSIGLQLVNDPACLFLDEPTSGLDALTAKTLVLTLKKIALAGRTVVCAIHQPRIDIWNEFDNVLLLMTGGRLAYAGKASDAIAYFERAGHVPPELTNAPDFIIDTLSVNHRSPQLEASSRAVTDNLYALHCQQHSDDLALDSATKDLQSQQPLGRVSPHYAGFLRASLVLTHRNFTDTFRQRGRYFYRIVGPSAIIVLVTLVYWRFGNDSLSVYTRLGYFQQSALGAIPGALVTLDLYPRQREVAFREISNGVYCASAFFVSYILNEVPLSFFTSFIAMVLMFCITGLRLSAEMAVFCYVACFGYISLGETMALIFLTLTPYVGLAFIASSSVILWLSFIGGIMTPTLPWFLHYLNYANPFRYSFRLMVQNELQGLQINCIEGEIQKGLCLFSKGDQVIRYLQMADLRYGHDLLMFSVLCVLYRLTAWAVIVIRVRLYGRKQSVDA